MYNRTARLLAALLGGVLLASASACATTAPVSDVPITHKVQIGYGAQDPRDVMGAITSITDEEIGAMSSGHVEEILRDRVPGLEVRRGRNGEFSVRIRGSRSLIGNNDPLVVIDGIAASGSSAVAALSLLSPQTIARIDVLKDAGSLAAFGSRGMNGVILVTTRRGR